jgi:digeranylgeranylglycerophospholipid reductase
LAPGGFPMIAPAYDVVVIGAGPSGSICARNLARAGYSVLLCEKRPVVGVPVRCGEATGPVKRLADFTTIDEAWIETRFTGVVFHGPAGISLKYDAGRELGAMLDRRLFDQHLARDAAASGAQLHLGARVTSVASSTGPGAGHRTVTVEKDGNTFAVRTKMVVGADGAESLSGRMAGLKTRQLPNGTCTAIELRIRAQDPNPDCLTFWGGHDSIPKGYVWAFPKVKSGVVNLGSGELVPKMGARTQLQLSTEYRDRYYPGAVIEEVHGGAVPVSGHMKEYTAERFALCGDAAHHTNPLTGGGIVPGMLGGEILASWIDKGFKEGDLSAAFLKKYEVAMWERNGRQHAKEMAIRDFIIDLGPRDQEWFYRILKGMTENMTGGKMSLPSKIVGYTRLGLLAAKNFGHMRKTFFAKG